MYNGWRCPFWHAAVKLLDTEHAGLHAVYPIRLLLTSIAVLSLFPTRLGAACRGEAHHIL